jgi:hypothetical protein
VRDRSEVKLSVGERQSSSSSSSSSWFEFCSSIHEFVKTLGVIRRHCVLDCSGIVSV